MPRLLVLLSVMTAVTFGIGSASAQTAPDAAKVKDLIWAKELALIASHAKGDVTYYSPDFLGWTYGLPKPFRMSDIPPKSATAPKAPDQEKVETAFRDFSLHGDTAIIYYVNHRTMRADGTPVDESLDFVHVWVRDGNDWKVMASMSRQSGAKK